MRIPAGGTRVVRDVDVTAVYDWPKIPENLTIRYEAFRVAPGGLLVATNVHLCNPRRLTMEYVMEWNLIYRDCSQMEALRPESAAADDLFICSDDTGVNVYVEVRKPNN
jgi:hypothetical protein